MEKEVKIPLNPSVTLQSVSDILSLRFPECEVSKPQWSIQGNYIRLKKSMFVHAAVFVKQKEKEGITIIGINGMMSTMGSMLFGFIFHYLLRGSFLSDVADAIEEEVNILKTK